MKYALCPSKYCLVSYLNNSNRLAWRNSLIYSPRSSPLRTIPPMKMLLNSLVSTSVLVVSLCAAWALPAQAQTAPAATAGTGLPAKFDPKRDAAQDVATAVAQAKSQGKRVLVDVGGEWCPWCHILDRFIAANADVKQLLDANYVWVKVNYSPDNKNEALLARWPKVKGYPHIFVLDADGKLLQSQDTGALEAGNDYDKPKVLAFLKQFAVGVGK